MENVYVQINVEMVRYNKEKQKIIFFLLFFLLAFCPFPCLNGGRCTGFYQCTCRQGWQGHRCERRGNIIEK